MKKNYQIEKLLKNLQLNKNPFHPLVCINGKPKIGKNVYIGIFSEVNAKGAKVTIGNNCDIASFVAINCADSHKKCIGLKKKNSLKNIMYVNNDGEMYVSGVFLGNKLLKVNPNNENELLWGDKELVFKDQLQALEARIAALESAAGSP